MEEACYQAIEAMISCLLFAFAPFQPALRTTIVAHRAIETEVSVCHGKRKKAFAGTQVS